MEKRTSVFIINRYWRFIYLLPHTHSDRTDRSGEPTVDERALERVCIIERGCS